MHIILVTSEKFKGQKIGKPTHTKGESIRNAHAERCLVQYDKSSQSFFSLLELRYLKFEHDKHIKK